MVQAQQLRCPGSGEDSLINHHPVPALISSRLGTEGHAASHRHDRHDGAGAGSMCWLFFWIQKLAAHLPATCPGPLCSHVRLLAVHPQRPGGSGFDSLWQDPWLDRLY